MMDRVMSAAGEAKIVGPVVEMPVIWKKGLYLVKIPATFVRVRETRQVHGLGNQRRDRDRRVRGQSERKLSKV